MGRASLTSSDFPSGGAEGIGTLAAGGRQWGFRHVSIGNPQCVIDVGNQVEELDLGAVGPEVDRRELLPNRTNASFLRIDCSAVRARVFQRGVGWARCSVAGGRGA